MVGVCSTPPTTLVYYRVVVGDQNQGKPVFGSIPIASRSSLLGFGLGALFEGLLIKDMLTVTLLESIWVCLACGYRGRRGRGEAVWPLRLESL